MAELDTNFVDAVLSANMNGKKRVRLTQIAENEYIVEDITEYEKVGSEYGQKEINTLNETVNGKVNKVEVIDDLDTVKAVTEDNVPVGCKAVTKLANDVNQSLTQLKDEVYKEPSQINNIYNYTSEVQQVLEYECEETGIYVINISGSDFFTHCFITDKQNAVQILGMSNNGVATKIQCTNQCKMYKGHKYNIELWNATFKMYKY